LRAVVLLRITGCLRSASEISSLCNLEAAKQLPSSSHV
jgi:hypothetical protein